jgi:hypothetical protein
LGDREQTPQTINKRVNPDIYKEIRPLLAMRLNESILKTIDDSYGLNPKSRLKK